MKIKAAFAELGPGPLHRFAVPPPHRAGDEMLAQVIVGDWPGFLSLFDIAPESADAEGHSAALALWLAARDNRANPLATLWRGTAIANEVAQFSATSDAEPERADEEGPTPEERPPQ